MFNKNLNLQTYNIDYLKKYEDKHFFYDYPIANIVKTINNHEINSFGYRCDEFTNNKQHVIFTGCSVTYGVGLEINETWANFMYNLYKGS